MLLVQPRTGKVPLDARCSEEARLFRLKELKDFICVCAVDVRLCHNVKRDTVVLLAECVDALFVLWVLVGELIAREAENDEAPVLVLLVQVLQLCKLWRKAAL